LEERGGGGERILCHLGVINQTENGGGPKNQLGKKVTLFAIEPNRSQGSKASIRYKGEGHYRLEKELTIV